MHLRSRPRIGFAGTADLDKRGREVAPDLASGLEDLGYEISEDLNCQVLIHVNHNWRSMSEFEQRDPSERSLKVLLRVEPASVYPKQYERDIEARYDLILTPGSTSGSEEEFLRWPYAYHQNPSTPTSNTTGLEKVIRNNLEAGVYSYENWKNRPIEFSMVAANKISPNGTGNYELRRKFGDYEFSNRLKVYGGLWKSSFGLKLKYRISVLKFALQSKSEFRIRSIASGLTKNFKNAVGTVEDKHSVIMRSKFSVVIENSDHYVSEKLLDVLVGGSIPIYYGPDLSRSNIPEALVMRCARERPELIQILDEASPNEIEVRLNRILLFLNSAEFALWKANRVHAEICARIHDMIISAGESC